MQGAEQPRRLLAVRVGPDAITTACTDAHGKAMTRLSQSLTSGAPDEKVVADVIGRACHRAGIAPSQLDGACLALSHRWSGLDHGLRAHLDDHLGLPLSTWPEPALAALAEARWGAGRGLPSFLMVADDPHTTVTYVRDGRPIEGAGGPAGLSTALTPELFRTAATATPAGTRSAWAMTAMRIAPLLSASCLLTGVAVVVINVRLPRQAACHFLDHLKSRLHDVMPAHRPQLLLARVTGDPVLRGALAQAHHQTLYRLEDRASSVPQ